MGSHKNPKFSDVDVFILLKRNFSFTIEGLLKKFETSHSDL